jgi:molecular chaperone DnaK
METILGIDLGTTNSVVAVYRNGAPEVLGNGEALLPSVVGLDDRGELIVGQPARNQLVLAPDRTIKSIKRKMGQDVKVSLGDQQFTPQEISAIILRRLKQQAEEALGEPVQKAVITVPAFFSEVQREATREAGRLAGLDVVRIINEPTAAALTYDPNPSGRERLLVYDLGGGTFDVSIVQIEQGVVEVLASHGDTQLGGDDFDQLLLDHVCDEFQVEHGIDLRKSLKARSRLLRSVEEAKKALSFEPVVALEEEFIAEADGLPLHLKMEIHRDEYEGLIEPLLSKTLVSVDEALDAAGLTAQQIDKVVLVGGATRTPAVGRLLEDRLRQPLHLEVNPDLGVALGAAIQGGMIAGYEVGPVLVDITPHTLGIAALGPLYGTISPNHFSPIIARNTPLPATRSEIYTTTYDGQDAAQIQVYQGEHQDVSHNQLIGGFLLDGLADVSEGNEVLVRFDLDLDGILKVAAVERATGRQKGLVIENTVERSRRARAANQVAQAPRAAAAEHNRVFTPAAVEKVAPARMAAETPEFLEARQRAASLMEKAGHLVGEVNAADAADLTHTLEGMAGALSAGNLERVRQLTAKLEDLVFYLQDA